MSYCINPRCPYPDDPTNDAQPICRHCGSSLQILDRYRALNLLSDSSGFARIYTVSDGTTLKILKCLKPEHNSNVKVIDLFRQEVAVLGHLDHPGVPKISPEGYFQYHPRQNGELLHCFIMERIDGPNLREWMLQQGDLLISEAQALDWLRQITEILHLVHQKNYFHRDIKLQNIMVRSNGQLVLIDFGAAREMTYTYLARLGSAGNVTRVSSVGYTPPEQEKGHPVPQSDFFALGRTFVYLLTGKSVADTDLYDPLTDEFRWRDYAPDLSPDFADFLDRLMARRAAERPRDTQEILEALAVLRERLASHRQSRRATRLLATVVQPDSPTTPQEPPAASAWGVLSSSAQEWLGSPRSRGPLTSPWLLGGMAASLLLVGGYGSWQAYQRLPLPLLLSHPVAMGRPRTLTGHGSFVNAIAISPDSQVLVSASADRTIRVWNLGSGRPQRILRGHQSHVNDVAISVDGRWLFSASADRTIKVWDLATGAVTQTLSGHTEAVDRLLLSTDGTLLASAGADFTIRLWDLQTGTLRHTLQGHTSHINAITISPDGRWLVSAGADKSARVWDLDAGRLHQTLLGHTSFINALAISPDGEWLATGSADKTIKRWDLATGQELQTLRGHAGFVNDLAIAPDGQWLISASADQTIRLWELPNGQPGPVLQAHDNFVNELTLSLDGRTLFSSSADRTIRLWELPSGRLKQTLDGYEQPIDHFSVSPDGRYVVTGSNAKIVRVWPL